MSDFVKRSVALLLIQVMEALPNGDPDRDNGPRANNDGFGFITDVSIKAKIRQIIADHVSPVFQAFVNELKFNPEEHHIFESVRRGTNYHEGDYTGEDALRAKREVLDLAESNPVAFLSRFFDVRLFGGNLLEQGALVKNESSEEPVGEAKKKVKKSKKERAPGRRFIRTGPVTITPAKSVAPISVQENTLTRRFPLTEDNLGKLQGDMAPMAKKWVEHGLYVARLTVNPVMAPYSSLRNEDIAVLKRILRDVFTFTASAARPGGSMNFVHIWWADHESVLGSFSECEFWEKLTPRRKGDPMEPSKSLDDYDIPTPESAGLTYKVEDLAVVG